MLGELFAGAARLFLCPRATRGAVSRHASPPSRHGTPDARHGGRAGGTRVSSPRKRGSLIPLSRLCIKWIHGSGPGSRNHSFIYQNGPGYQEPVPGTYSSIKVVLAAPFQFVIRRSRFRGKSAPGPPFSGKSGVFLLVPGRSWLCTPTSRLQVGPKGRRSGSNSFPQANKKKSEPERGE